MVEVEAGLVGRDVGLEQGIAPLTPNAIDPLPAQVAEALEGVRPVSSGQVFQCAFHRPIQTSRLTPRRRWTQSPAPTRAPIFFLQAKNDYSLSALEALSAEMARLGKPHQVRVYPDFGSSAQQGHEFCTLAAEEWGPEVFAFFRQPPSLRRETGEGRRGLVRLCWGLALPWPWEGMRRSAWGEAWGWRVGKRARIAESRNWAVWVIAPVTIRKPGSPFPVVPAHKYPRNA